MKMTRLEWRYLQKKALDHPYYDTHKPPLTEEQAEAIIKEQVTRTGKEFVDSVYAQAGRKRPEKAYRRFAWMADAFGMLRVPPIRKIAIAILAAVLLTVFLAATPAGRAVAEGVVRIITEMIDGTIHTRNEMDGLQNPGKHRVFSCVPEGVTTPQTAAAIWIGYPVAAAEDELIEFSAEKLSENAVSLSSRYRTRAGETYQIDQILYAQESFWGSAAEGERIREYASGRFGTFSILRLSSGELGARLHLETTEIYLSSPEQSIELLTGAIDRLHVSE